MNGDTDITLAGKTVTLKCTPRALRDLDGMAGSFAEILAGLSQYRFSTYCSVVAAGLAKRPADVEEAVFETGMDSLITPLTLYVGRLMRGGRDKAPTEEERKSGEA